MSSYHIPVMLEETIKYLNVQSNCWYIDCNLGGGGHTEGILNAGGKVIGIDLDPDAIHEVAQKHSLKVEKIDDHLEAHSPDLILYQGNFANIKEVISNLSSWSEAIGSNKDSISRLRSFQNDFSIKGILFDLGVSTHQLETDQRGFSFNKQALLDMRMDQTKEVATATDLINGLHEGELTQLFWTLGEEHLSRPIAKAIVRFREHKKIETTDELAQIVLSVRPRRPMDRTHPATRIFQALRIAVNDELHSLQAVLPQAFEILAPGGRLVTISFHSLEDRIVKDFFKDLKNQGQANILTPKPLEPAQEEVNNNIKSHSAKFRSLEKTSSDSNVTDEPKEWLKQALEEDGPILDELAKR